MFLKWISDIVSLRNMLFDLMFPPASAVPGISRIVFVLWGGGG